jgi:hypothetical protein
MTTHEERVKSEITDCLNTGIELSQYARTALVEQILKAFMFDVPFREGTELNLKEFDVKVKVYSRKDGETGFRFELLSIPAAKQTEQE